VDSEPACCSCSCKVLIESLTEVLAPTIGVKYLDPSAMLLSDCPSFKELIVLEGFVLCGDQVNGCETSSIIHEGDKILFPLHCCSACWSPHIYVDLVPEVQGQDADARLGYRDAGGMHKDACFGVSFGCVGIELDPLDSPILNEFAGTCNGYVSKAAVQLHDRQELDSISRLQRALILVEATCVAYNIHDQLSSWRDELEVSVSNMGCVSLFV